MNSENRAGGSWIKPWSTIDHVRSQLVHARALLVKDLPHHDDTVLLTADEVALIRLIADAIAIVDWIKK